MVSLRKILWSAAYPHLALRQLRRVRSSRARHHIIGEVPFMPPAAVRGLRGLLDGAELMIEYGSGGSTIILPPPSSPPPPSAALRACAS